MPQQNGSDRADRSMARGSDAERLAALLPNMTPLRATDIYVTGGGKSRQLREEREQVEPETRDGIGTWRPEAHPADSSGARPFGKV